MINKEGDNMKAQKTYRILIVASMFTAFIVYLCRSLVNSAPLFIIAALLCAFVVALQGFVNSDYTAVKLYTQKAE